MESIMVKNVYKEFEYYKKQSGLSGSIHNLFKREKLIKKAVENVSFSIQKGEIAALLGSNGAGKSTTLKMLSGILYPTSGEIVVGGYIPLERKNAYKKTFSIVMGQKNQLWWDLPANETFFMNKKLYEVEDKKYERVVEELSELLDVKHIMDVQVRRLSLGERMKMEIMASLIHSPQILFLDEPTIGLDIISQRKIRDFLKYYNEQTKTTIILTSHYTKDIETLCKRAVIINRGGVVFDGELAQINEVLGEKKLLNVKFNSQVEKEVLSEYGGIREYDGYEVTLEVEKGEMKACCRDLLEKLPVEDFTVTDIPLEEGIEKFYRKETKVV